MLDYLKKAKVYSFLISLLILSIGILITINPNGSLFFVAEIMGTIIFITGVAISISSFLKSSSFLPIGGGLIALAGLFVLIYPAAIIGFAISFIGIAIFIHAFFEMKKAAEARELGYSGWKLLTVSGSIKIICALVVIFVPFFASEVILRIVGILIIFEAITHTISMLKFFKDIDALQAENTSDNIIDI